MRMLGCTPLMPSTFGVARNDPPSFSPASSRAAPMSSTPQPVPTRPPSAEARSRSTAWSPSGSYPPSSGRRLSASRYAWASLAPRDETPQMTGPSHSPFLPIDTRLGGADPSDFIFASRSRRPWPATSLPVLSSRSSGITNPNLSIDAPSASRSWRFGFAGHFLISAMGKYSMRARSGAAEAELARGMWGAPSGRLDHLATADDSG